ncbi:MAG: hypothetical protein FP816_18450 [Desulfobacteraceae bacterium]|nr:hypothetical protein [Desulfobacteraceae bacterium]MBU4002800.1 P-loop NTPase [Pseudomonadota bacterium]MBU4055674.1 P-loop NTPase [Pseudomonadota bacterium]
MGIFHCPFGCPHFEAEGCIECGLCLATTNEEMVEASKNVRAYLKAHAMEGGPVRKIAICGKGGVGKSTTTTLMARVLKDQGYTPLVVDTDESNPGLYRALGLPNTPKPLFNLMSRFSYSETPEPGTEWIMLPEINLEDIPREYMVSDQGMNFVMVGKIENPFQGCACSMADVTRSLVARLKLKDKEILLIDTEAGLESFGRGVERSVDLILAVVEPSFESMALAERIVYMAEGMGVDRVGALLNKVSSKAMEEKMILELKKRKVETLGTIYFDADVLEAGFEGNPPGNTRAQAEMEPIAKLLLNVIQQSRV